MLLASFLFWLLTGFEGFGLLEVLAPTLIIHSLSENTQTLFNKTELRVLVSDLPQWRQLN